MGCLLHRVVEVYHVLLILNIPFTTALYVLVFILIDYHFILIVIDDHVYQYYQSVGIIVFIIIMVVVHIR